MVLADSHGIPRARSERKVMLSATGLSPSRAFGLLRLALAAPLRHRLNWVKGVGAHFPSLIELFRKSALPFFTGSELVF